MKIDLLELSKQSTFSTAKETKMHLSENATSMVFQLFIKNVYSNPIGTIVREITSNCFDSHVEAGVTSPVLIKKSVDKETDTIYISFIDYGMGMSPTRIEDTYNVLFESTKRDDNTQIGGWGVGSKSILAYKRSTGNGEGEYDNSFFVITIYDGIKYYYCIYEGKETPIISPLYQEPTTEHNGTEVRIPVLQKDLSAFKKEMIRQLYYFENVIFDGFTYEDDYGSTDLTNDYQIIRAKTFLFRGNQYSENVHICLGRVAYPIDYSILGLSSADFRFPVAIRLNVGDIGVTVSRESLDYSEATIKMLKRKLIEVKSEITEMLINQYDNICSLEDYFKIKTKYGQLYFSNGSSFNVSNVIKMSDVSLSNFKYSFLKMPSDKQLFNLFFNRRLCGKKESRYSTYFEGSYADILEKKNLYFLDDDYKRKIVKQAYLKEQHDRYYLISKKNLTKAMMSDICEMFNRHDVLFDTNGLPTNFMLSLFELQEEFFEIITNHVTNYNDIIVPDDFIATRTKKVVDAEIRNNFISLKLISYTSFNQRKVKLASLFDLNYTIVYGTRDDEHELIRAKQIFDLLFDGDILRTYYDEYYNKFTHSRRKSKKGIIFIMLGQQNVKYMQYCHKAVHIDQFYNKMMYRKSDTVLQYFQSYDIVHKYNEIKSLFTSKCFKMLDSSLEAKIDKLNNFITSVHDSKYDNIFDYKSMLFEYFKITDIKANSAYTEYFKIIDELINIQKKNKDILRYINIPYDVNSIDNLFIDILRQLIVL